MLQGGLSLRRGDPEMSERKPLIAEVQDQIRRFGVEKVFILTMLLMIGLWLFNSR